MKLTLICTLKVRNCLTSCRFISFGLRDCVAPSRTSNVSLQSLLSRRLEAGAVAVETRVAVMEDDELETVAEITRVFIIEEEGGGGAALSVRLSLRKLMERCREERKLNQIKKQNCITNIDVFSDFILFLLLQQQTLIF